jgi:hypothetical protein
MINSNVLSNVLAVVAILSTVPAAPVLAQTAVHGTGAYAFLHPDGALAVPPRQQIDDAVVGRGTDKALILTQSFHPSMAGKEMTTRPWTAPVGHRQPHADDVPASASQSWLDQEDANVDRKISGICRGR